MIITKKEKKKLVRYSRFFFRRTHVFGVPAERVWLELVDILHQRHDIALLPIVARMVADQTGREEAVDIYTAETPTEHLAHRITHTLQFRGTIRLHHDPSLISGIIVRYKNWLIDASSRRQLNEMKTRLTH